jgi:hypothetical protein
VLLDFAAWFHKTIHHIDTGQLDDWGYAERDIIGMGSTDISNHASGTAMDLDATAHPLGKYNTFNSLQISLIERKLKEYGGVIRWGHDYSGRKDEMHFEINKGYAAVKAQADRIRAKNGHPAPTATPAPSKSIVPPFPGNLNALTTQKNGYLLKWQDQMHKRGWAIHPDGNGGPETARVCVQFKHEKKILPYSEIIDRATWTAAWKAPK